MAIPVSLAYIAFLGLLALSAQARPLLENSGSDTDIETSRIPWALPFSTEPTYHSSPPPQLHKISDQHYSFILTVFDKVKPGRLTPPSCNSAPSKQVAIIQQSVEEISHSASPCPTPQRKTGSQYRSFTFMVIENVERPGRQPPPTSSSSKHQDIILQPEGTKSTYASSLPTPQLKTESQYKSFISMVVENVNRPARQPPPSPSSAPSKHQDIIQQPVDAISNTALSLPTLQLKTKSQSKSFISKVIEDVNRPARQPPPTPKGAPSTHQDIIQQLVNETSSFSSFLPTP